MNHRTKSYSQILFLRNQGKMCRKMYFFPPRFSTTTIVNEEVDLLFMLTRSKLERRGKNKLRLWLTIQSRDIDISLTVGWFEIDLTCMENFLSPCHDSLLAKRCECYNPKVYFIPAFAKKVSFLVEVISTFNIIISLFILTASKPCFWCFDIYTLIKKKVRKPCFTSMSKEETLRKKSGHDN